MIVTIFLSSLMSSSRCLISRVEGDATALKVHSVGKKRHCDLPSPSSISSSLYNFTRRDILSYKMYHGPGDAHK